MRKVRGYRWTRGFILLGMEWECSRTYRFGRVRMKSTGHVATRSNGAQRSGGAL